MSAPLRLDRYETLFRLASGGMAEVHVACRRGEGDFVRVVAVKRMLQHLANEPSFVDMFLDEARLAAAIRSPHVVQTVDVGRAEDGSLFLVMDLVIGVALSDLLGDTIRADCEVPIPVAAEIIAQAADGLHDAHEARSPAGGMLEIVHRDVSPQNVLVGKDGRARVSDFGVARALHRRTTTITGQLKGKYAYFSPEQALGEPLDRRSDVFALGIVAWELFALRRLFASPEGAAGVLEQVRTKPIPRLDDLVRDFPPELATAVAKALERDRDARYASARDFAAALRGAADDCRSDDIARYVDRVSRGRIRRLETRVEEALATLSKEPTLDGMIDATPSATEGPQTGPLLPHPNGSGPAVGPTAVTRAERAPIPPTRTTAPTAGTTAAPRSSGPGPERVPRAMWIGVGIAGVFFGVLGFVMAWGSNLGSPDAPQADAPQAGDDQAGDDGAGASLDAGGLVDAHCSRDRRDGCADRCAAGDVEACFREGEALALGIHGVRRDRPAGLALLRRACDGGVGRACLLASTVWRLENRATPTEGWEREYERLTTQGCDLELGNACRRLARALADGDELEARPADALRFAERGCEYGDNYSCRILAELYRTGVGTPVDETRAIESLSVACGRRDVIACRLLQNGR